MSDDPVMKLNLWTRRELCDFVAGVGDINDWQPANIQRQMAMCQYALEFDGFKNYIFVDEPRGLFRRIGLLFDTMDNLLLFKLSART